MPKSKIEIGGYMEMETFRGSEYHTDALRLNSGRHCLEYILRARNIKKIYLPYFLCASVRKICEKCQTEYEFYHIDAKFNPLISNMDGRFVRLYSKLLRTEK